METMSSVPSALATAAVRKSGDVAVDRLRRGSSITAGVGYAGFEKLSPRRQTVAIGLSGAPRSPILSEYNQLNSQQKQQEAQQVPLPAPVEVTSHVSQPVSVEELGEGLPSIPMTSFAETFQEDAFGTVDDTFSDVEDQRRRRQLSSSKRQSDMYGTSMANKSGAITGLGNRRSTMSAVSSSRPGTTPLVQGVPTMIKSQALQESLNILSEVHEEGYRQDQGNKSSDPPPQVILEPDQRQSREYLSFYVNSK